MPWSRPALTNLRRILARLYPRESQQRRLVVEAGLREAAVAFDAQADDSWFEILRYAAAQGRLDELLSIARGENPDNELLQRAEEEVPPTLLTGPDIGAGWRGPGDALPLLEQLTGAQSSLVPISHLSLGLRRARAVARVRLADGSVASGFLTPGNLLVTNHHVLPDERTAAAATVQFNYQLSESGTSEPIDERKLVPAQRFVTSEPDDWTAVLVEGNPEERWGCLPLARSTLNKGDRVNIIQHPGGGYKQLSFFANLVAFVGGGRAQYLTDTLPGSSGSPVFDRDWNLVAVHHSGGVRTVAGPGPTDLYYCNEGILIDLVVEALARDERAARAP